ncbi:MAG: hypothetical protein KF803_10720 [Cyclobacteriaceae bacterium]|nr:hypothetical protein [Cyclobacteriaceae bacterium]
MRIIFLLTVLPLLSYSQQFPITLSLNQPVIAAFVDRPGDLYLQFESSVIQKFDINGKLIEEVKPESPLALFEPRDGSRAFSYDRSGNWYSYALFGNFNKQSIPDEFAIEPWLVCSSGDQNIWILDGADLSIKKLNTGKQKIEVEIYLSPHLAKQKTDFIGMREYQNFLFIHNKNAGIEIHNAIGKRIRIIPGKEIKYFNFLGEELYYALDDKLIFFDLFDGKTRELPIENGVQSMLLTDERVYKVYRDRLVVELKNP